MYTIERPTSGRPTVPADPSAGIRLAAVDLYRDIHKGIRAELFAVASTAGSIDPANRSDRAALASHVDSIAEVLESHAHHEDSFIDPVLLDHRPDLAEQITTDHERLESRFGRMVELARGLVDASTVEQRRLAHHLYLDLASFTSSYLAHQDLEERVVMPALEREIGPEACGALHAAIVGSIPPDEMARTLSFMLPAMNVDDRAELLSGMRMAAPPEAFDAIAGLARSVLAATDVTALSARLGLS